MQLLYISPKVETAFSLPCGQYCCSFGMEAHYIRNLMLKSSMLPGTGVLALLQQQPLVEALVRWLYEGSRPPWLRLRYVVSQGALDRMPHKEQGTIFFGHKEEPSDPKDLYFFWVIERAQR